MHPIDIRTECEEIIRRLDRAVDEPAAKLSEDVDDAERALVRVRDRLIDDWRSGRPRPSALDHINVALSLVIGVEYPLGGLHRNTLRQARDVVTTVLAEGAAPRAA